MKTKRKTSIMIASMLMMLLILSMPFVIAKQIGDLSQNPTDTSTVYINKQAFASIRNDEVYYHHYDRMGNLMSKTNSSGNVVFSALYEPFGGIINSTDITDVQFNYKSFDTETGLFYFGARYYMPEIGRFITPDTEVGSLYNPQTLNQYLYGGNNPLRYGDANGHFWWFFVGLFNLAVNWIAQNAVQMILNYIYQQIFLWVADRIYEATGVDISGIVRTIGMIYSLKSTIQRGFSSAREFIADPGKFITTKVDEFVGSSRGFMDDIWDASGMAEENAQMSMIDKYMNMNLGKNEVIPAKDLIIIKGEVLQSIKDSDGVFNEDIKKKLDFIFDHDADCLIYENKKFNFVSHPTNIRVDGDVLITQQLKNGVSGLDKEELKYFRITSGVRTLEEDKSMWITRFEKAITYEKQTNGDAWKETSWLQWRRNLGNGDYMSEVSKTLEHHVYSVAYPGRSRHNNALSIDIGMNWAKVGGMSSTKIDKLYVDLHKYMTSNGWTDIAVGDRVHFDLKTN